MNTITMQQFKASKEVFFKLDQDSSVIYTYNHYDRSSKRYSISPVHDVNKERFIKGTKPIFIGFEY